MAILTQDTQTVNLNNDTFVVVDKQQGFVSINQGQRTGSAEDWGGQVVAFLTIEQAEAIAAILYAPWSQPDEAYRDVQPAEDRDGYVGM